MDLPFTIYNKGGFTNLQCYTDQFIFGIPGGRHQVQNRLQKFNLDEYGNTGMETQRNTGMETQRNRNSDCLYSQESKLPL